MSFTRRRPRAAGVFLVLAIGVAGRARVSSARTGDRAAAAELFRQGRRALEDKDYAGACPKFEESLRYDRRVGTFLSLAECEEGRGKLAVARTRFQEAEDLAREEGDSRASFARERFDAVDARVPRLVVRLSGEAPRDTSIERDGVAIGPATLDTPLPVEVGLHTLVASAPHHAPKTFEVTLAEGERRELSVEPGDSLPPEAVPVAATVENDAHPTAAPSAFEWRPARIAALGAGALGLVGVGVGSYFGIKAIHEQSGAPGICAGVDCNAQGSAVRWGAIRAGNASTVAFVAAGALGATGVVLWVVSPSKKRAARVGFVPCVEVGAASLHAFGSF